MNTPVTVASPQINTREMPFAEDFGAPGVRMQVLHCDVEAGMFAVRIRFPPGVQLPPHHHTGTVQAFTLEGEWNYLEQRDAEPNRAGSYLFEPAGTTHTLKVADHNTGETDVFFVIHGAMLIHDEHGHVAAVLDAASHLRDWPQALRDQGKAVPAFLCGGHVAHTR